MNIIDKFNSRKNVSDINLKIDTVNDILINILLSNIVYYKSDVIFNLLNTKEYILCKSIINKNTKYISDDNTDCQLYIFLDSEILYIVFRGTNSLKDIIIDLEIKQELYKKNIKIHSGGYKQFLSIKDKLFEYIQNNIEQIKTIHISGHSLGGLLATISAPFIAKHFKNNKINIECYTYGAPRAGNKYFKKYYKKYIKHTYRIEMFNDPIPKLPVNMRYVHVCKSINIKQDEKNNILISYIKDVPYMYRIYNWLCYINIAKILDEHKTESYIKCIKTLKTLKIYSLSDVISNDYNE